MPQHTLLRSFIGQDWFAPTEASSSFPLWRSDRLFSLWDISKRGKILSKSQIDRKIGTAVPWFEYQQVSCLFHQLSTQGKLCMDLTAFEQFMAARSLSVKGLLSTVYCCLFDKDMKFPLGYQKAWHSDFSKSIPKEASDSLWHSPLHTSRNVNDPELNGLMKLRGSHETEGEKYEKKTDETYSDHRKYTSRNIRGKRRLLKRAEENRRTGK